MGDINNIKLEPHFNIKSLLRIGKSTDISKGGDGGQIVIISEHISGEGKIIADGGDGTPGGKGGNIQIQAKNNSFTGNISARGGHNTK